MIQPIKIDYEAFGAEFANMNDNEQALFFKGIAKQLKHWETTHHILMQGTNYSTLLKKMLTQDERNLLSEFMQFTVGNEFINE